MREPYLMGIDVGTTGTKAVLFSLDGKPLASAYEEYGCTYPRPGWVEQDCATLIAAAESCCQRAMAASGLTPTSVAGVSVSAQRSCVVFWDDQHRPMKLISWLDQRAQSSVEEIEAKVGRESFYQITGLPLSTTWMLPKILHTRQHDPALWERTARVSQLQDMILHALGAQTLCSDEPEAGFFGLWDNRNLCWSRALLEAFHLDQALLPDIKPSGTVIGAVSAAAAGRTGLAPGTALCVGVGDQNSAALGAGVIRPGALSVSLGTGGLATAPLDRCYRDPAGQAMVTSHAIRGLWTFEGLQNAAAGAFRWFRDEIAALEKDRATQRGESAYDALNRMIAATPVGAKGLLMLPYLAGSAAPRWNPQARGAFLGLTFAHDRACMARACVEGITLEQKDIITSLTRSGAKFDLVRIVGGATNSPVWNQIQADVYGLPCETLAVTDAAALGAALCAGVGTGAFASWEEGVARMVCVDRRYEPNPAHVRHYDQLYGAYCAAYRALAGSDLYARLESLSHLE